MLTTSIVSCKSFSHYDARRGLHVTITIFVHGSYFPNGRKNTSRKDYLPASNSLKVTREGSNTETEAISFKFKEAPVSVLQMLIC